MTFDGQRLIIGHRGAAGLVPENTLASFQRAVELGVDAVELDVHLCEGRLCVIHDDSLDRTTSGSGLVAKAQFDELRALDAGDGESIPLLEEVLALIPDPVGINAELKGHGTAEALAVLLGTVEVLDLQRILVSSFDHQQLVRFHQLLPQVSAAPLYSRWNPHPTEIARQCSSRFINLSKKITTRSRCESILDEGYSVLVYTVNSVLEADEFFSMGAAGVFTDYPDRFQARRSS